MRCFFRISTGDEEARRPAPSGISRGECEKKNEENKDKNWINPLTRTTFRQQEQQESEHDRDVSPSVNRAGGRDPGFLFYCLLCVISRCW